jgi:hypothetical protein
MSIADPGIGSAGKVVEMAGPGRRCSSISSRTSNGCAFNYTIHHWQPVDFDA